MTEPDASRTAYDGQQFDVVVERWGERQREIVRQTREPARKQLLELPAGTLEPGEMPLETAKRELDEEVGLHGGEWRELATFYSSPGFCRERVHVFLAENVEDGEPSPEEGEDLEIVRWRVDEIDERLSELEDAKTIAGLLLYLRRKQT